MPGGGALAHPAGMMTRLERLWQAAAMDRGA
jgi:hypothetical protein